MKQLKKDFNPEKQERIDETARMLLAASWTESVKAVGRGKDALTAVVTQIIACYDMAEAFEAERERRIHEEV